MTTPRRAARTEEPIRLTGTPWAQFELLVDHLRDGVTVQGADGRVVYANEAGARLSGYATPEELLAAPEGDFLNRFELLGPDGKPLPLERLPGRLAMSGVAAEALMLVRERANGAERWSEVRSYPVYDRQNAVMFVVNIFRDMSESVRQRRLLEDQAQELEEQAAEAEALTEELEQSNQELSESLHILEESRRREEYLSLATAILGSSLDYDDTLQRVATLTVPELADWCSVDLREAGGEIRQVAVAHVNPDKVKWAKELRRKVPPDMNAQTGLPQVLRTGQPELYRTISDDMLVQSARDAEELAIIREIGFSSALIVPLHGKNIAGAITMVWAESAKHYSDEDLAFATELARRAAIAIERASLHREALAARADAERARAASEERSALLAQLFRLAAALSGALHTSDVGHVAIGVGRDAFGAAIGYLALLDESRTHLDLVHADGLPPDVVERYRHLPIDAPVAVAECVRTGEPVLIETDADFTRRFPGVAELRHQTGSKATAAFPVKVAGEVIGSLTFSYATERTFGSEYVSAARTFAKEVGQAWDRARSREELAAAKAAADAANSAKSVFLATMTHELRTPINAILGFAELMQMGMAGPTTDGQEDYLKRIRRSTEHLLELINDILDLSRIESGQFELNPKHSKLRDAIEEAIEIVDGEARARGLRLDWSCDPDIAYDGDRRRVRQILLNLLSNAIKFTPRDGTVRVTCEMAAAGVVAVTVADTGVGIKPADLARIFDAFSQGEQVYTREHGGTGLGLTISRRLARMMGGDVTVESSVGKGSRFTLTLPSPADRNNRDPREVSPSSSARSRAQ